MLEITLLPELDRDVPTLTEHQPVEFVCAAARGSNLALTVDGLALEPFLRPGDAAWRWRWNPGTAAGLHQLELLITDSHGNTIRQHYSLRVYTRKLDQERYEALIDDLQRVMYRLVAALSGAGAEGAILERGTSWQHSPAETFYALLETRLDTFASAVRRIAASPREHLRRTSASTPLGQANELSESAIAEIPRGHFEVAPPEAAADLQAALRPGGGLLPREVATQRAQPTTDTYEHRLLKQLLAQLARRARATGALAAHEAARLAASEAYMETASTRRVRAEAIVAGCQRAAATLRELRALPFLTEVGPLPAFRGATPLLQRDAAYREVYHMWQALRQQPQLAFDSPLFALPIAELPRLYESWCALQVAAALLTLGWEVRAQMLLETRQANTDEALEQLVMLNERTPLLTLARGSDTLILRYQPRYRPPRAKPPGANAQQSIEAQDSEAGMPYAMSLGSLDRYTHIPDLAIELWHAGTTPQVLLLDAKYRRDADGRGVPPDALADAYTYLGAIGYAGQRATLGAVLLYPGIGAPERFLSGVSTLPTLPGNSQQIATFLAELLPNST